MFCQGRIEAQSLVSPRATAIGAYLPLVNDTRDFGMNPAGLISLRDWEFSATTYLPTVGAVDGFVFHGLTLGKRFLERHAAAVQFSNGTLLEVVFPAQGIIIGPEPTTVDTRLSYSELFSLGYATALTPELSAGIGGRLRRESITDTQYQLEDTVIVRLPDRVRESNQWLIDLGIIWRPVPSLVLGVTARNLLSIGGTEFPSDLRQYELDSDPAAMVGVGYSLSDFAQASFQAGTDRTGAVGTEIRLSEGWAARGGLYMSDEETLFVYGFGAGLGWTYDFLQFDVSYLHFFDTGTHSGKIDPELFDPSVIHNIDLNPYSPARISFSVAARFGDQYNSNARIDGVEIDGPLFPVEREIYAYTPFGSVYVTNTSQEPLHVRAAFYLEGSMDAPAQSGPFFAAPGEQVRIPLTAVFNDRLGSAGKTMIRDAAITVTSLKPGELDDSYSVRMVVHGRNAWSGSAEALRYFVTPDEPAVLRYTRDILLKNRADSSGGPGDDAFAKAKILIDSFAGKLLYVGDPRLSADVVQYPVETLEMNGGDCDDMTVCFSSLLNSIGIATAFVDVVPPDDPAAAHVYLLFDTGLSPTNGSQISDNPKRYVVRTGANGKESIWIPIETTVIADGFDRAWEVGSEEYYDDVEINLGLIKGWVRLVDVY